MATLGRCLKIFVKSGIPHVLKNTCVSSRSQHIRTFSRLSALWSEKKFSEKHEWITVDGKIGTIGISDHAQDALGDIVYAQLPEEGEEFDQDDECGALESVKAASELYTPVTGTVTAKNDAVEAKPALINKDCYGEGWLFKVELGDPAEIDGLMTEDQYKDFLKEQEQ